MNMFWGTESMDSVCAYGYINITYRRYDSIGVSVSVVLWGVWVAEDCQLLFSYFFNDGEIPDFFCSTELDS